MEQVIDLMAIWLKLWKSRRLLVFCAAVSAVVGVVVAIAIPREYTSIVILAPESSKSSGTLASAATMLGLAQLNIGAEGDALGVAIYPDIVASTPFLLEIMTMEVEPKTSLAEYLNKETISLDIDPLCLTREQGHILDILRHKIVVSVDKKIGVTTISVTMPDPRIAAEVAQRVTTQLQSYVTAYRTSKAQAEFDYWRQLYAKRQEEYYATQKRYADYVDTNHKVVLQSVLNKREQLQNDKALALQLYTTVATQMQMARAKVEEAKPIFAIIEPATTPLRPSGSGRVIIALEVMLGGIIISALWVVIKK